MFPQIRKSFSKIVIAKIRDNYFLKTLDNFSFCNDFFFPKFKKENSKILNSFADKSFIKFVIAKTKCF